MSALTLGYRQVQPLRGQHCCSWASKSLGTITKVESYLN